MKLRRVVELFEETPRGYGVAWEDPARRTAVCYPIPLNLLFGWLRRIRWELARPPRGPRAQAADVERIVAILTDACDDPTLDARAPAYLISGLHEAHGLAVRLLDKLKRWEKTEDTPWRSWLRRAGGGWGMRR